MSFDPAQQSREELRNKHKELEGLKKAFEEHLSVCKGEKDDLEDQIDDAMTKAEQLEEELAELKKENEELQHSNASKGAGNAETEAQLLAITRERDQLKMKLANSEEDITILQEDLAALEAGESVSGLKEQLAALQAQLDNNSQIVTVAGDSQTVVINNETHTVSELREMQSTMTSELVTMEKTLHENTDRLQAELRASQEQLKEQLKVNEELLKAMDFLEVLKRKKTKA